jgi:lysophospholipase L1-like esterase
MLLLIGALSANQNWWDRHFMPLFFFLPERYVLVERLARLGLGLIGIALILFVRPLIGRMAQGMPPREIAFASLRMGLAVALALVVSELMLDQAYTFAAAETQPGEEPARQPDRKLGWVFTPAHEGHAVVGGRKISYAIDALGYRVRSRDTPVNVALPSILFAGESIIAGYGLNWDETIPAQVGDSLGLQSATTAVFGYANDQAYLRLAQELPRFQSPVAIISLFIPSLFARNLGDDRPHLGPGLGWRPATHRSWLGSLFRFLVPYHSEAEIEEGIRTTREVLTATADLARRRGAIPLVVDAQYGPESPVERMLRQRILDESGIAYVRVSLDRHWHLKDDLHPDPRAARVIATAIAARLQAGLAQQAGGPGLARPLLQ